MMSNFFTFPALDVKPENEDYEPLWLVFVKVVVESIFKFLNIQKHKKHIRIFNFFKQMKRIHK